MVSCQRFCPAASSCSCTLNGRNYRLRLCVMSHRLFQTFCCTSRRFLQFPECNPKNYPLTSSWTSSYSSHTSLIPLFPSKTLTSFREAESLKFLLILSEFVDIPSHCAWTACSLSTCLWTLVYFQSAFVLVHAFCCSPVHFTSISCKNLPALFRNSM